MLRDLFRGSVGLVFSSESDGESPEISMADYLSEVFFSEKPSGCGPAFDHAGIAPARDVMGSLLHTALRALDNVCGSETFVQRGRKLQPLNREHFGHAFA